MRIRSEKIILIRSAWAGLCLGLVLWVGCDKPGIEVYTVQPLPSRVTVPQGWKEVPASSMMRSQKQRFEITGEDGNTTAMATLTVLPGKAKDVSMDDYLRQNIDRWRMQVGLGPLAEEAKVGDYLKSVPGLPDEARCLDVNGTLSSTVGVLVPYSRAVWVYKLSGDPMVVGKERDVFLKLLPAWQ